ncbi:MAG: tyrosine-type recombinase/integrase [Planctomycetota bacterium]|nr:tyrosine-type recombinase/integrase [Planctomycetota bacterium]
MKKPYFKKSHQCWYVNGDNGKPIRLDKDEEKAFDLWQRMRDAATDVSPSCSFARLAAEYLTEHEKPKDSFRKKAQRIVSFADYVGQKQASKITKRDVRTWLDLEKPGQKKKDGTCVMRLWRPRTKKDAFSDVNGVYVWAVNEGLQPKNPIRGMELEQYRPRSRVLTKEEQKRIFEAADPQFRLYLYACSCGPRPRQVREVEARHVSPDGRTWVFQDHKTRHKTNRPLVVYLDAKLQEITKQLMEKHPTGPLFRNSHGNPWKKDNTSKRFARLRDSLGISKDVCNYTFRHTFATQALLKNIPLLAVSKLLGHVDTRMVSQTYGHIEESREYLLELMQKSKDD